MRNMSLLAGAFLAASVVITFPAHALTVIVSPAAATAPSSNGLNDLDIGNTIDQSGLFTGFDSGVTEFDSYIASDPLHNAIAAGNEWFSAPQGSLHYSRLTLDFDLGAVYNVDRLAFWNEEYAGIRSFDLSASVDGVTYTALGNFTPTNHPGTTSGVASVVVQYSYLPDVFTFAQTEMRYFRVYTGKCPAPGSLGYWGCSLGEIAVGAEASAVPVPASMPLLAAALGGFGLIARRRRKA